MSWGEKNEKEESRHNEIIFGSLAKTEGDIKSITTRKRGSLLRIWVRFHAVYMPREKINEG